VADCLHDLRPRRAAGRTERVVPRGDWTPLCTPAEAPCNAATPASGNQLVLRSALEAGWCLARLAMRAFTNSERASWKLALHGGLVASPSWAGGQPVGVAGYDYEIETKQDRVADHQSRRKQTACEDMALWLPR
jgi:hypothetical protein